MQEKREKNSFYCLCTDHGKKSTNYAQEKSRFIGYTQSYPHYPHFMCVEYLIYIRKKETDVLCKMINRHFWTKKSTNLLTFLYSKKHIILYKKDKI